MLNCYSLGILLSHRSYRIVRDHVSSLFRAWRSSTHPFKTIHRVLPDHCPSTALLAHLPRTPKSLSRARGAAAHSRTTTGRVSLHVSLSPYTIRFKAQLAACLLHILAQHQLQIGVSATLRDREVYSQGITAFSRTFPSVLLPLPLTVLPPEFCVRIDIFSGLILLFI